MGGNETLSEMRTRLSRTIESVIGRGERLSSKFSGRSITLKHHIRSGERYLRGARLPDFSLRVRIGEFPFPEKKIRLLHLMETIVLILQMPMR